MTANTVPIGCNNQTNYNVSFLSDYRDYASGNESPPTYHLFSSLVALSSIISRRVWVDMGHFTLYPNLYVVLVGPPGIKKSTAISIAKGLLYALKNVPFSGECTSKEKLVLDMVAEERTIDGLPERFASKVKYSPITVMASELSEFFSISGDGMVGFLTDVFDINFPYEHKTKNKGSVIIHGPYLNILAGTTPSWMTTYLRGDIITGGFTRRCLFIYETERQQRIAFPKITDENRRAWASVFAAAERIRVLKGEFAWDEEARAFYTHWYETYKSPADPNTVGYYETKHVQLIKLAMLHAISEREELVIRKDNLIAGLGYLELIESNLGRVFEGMGRNELASVATKILELIRKMPEITVKTARGAPEQIRCFPTKKLQSVIYSELPTSVPDAFNKVLEQLTQTDRITRRTFAIDGIEREYVVLK